MQFVVSTHSRLLRIDLDAHWRITDMAVLADGPHFGIALAPPLFLACRSMPNVKPG